MDHIDIAIAPDASVLSTLHVRMPQLPTSSTELSQQINDNAKNVSRPCLNRVVTCVPTARWVPDAQATQCMAPDCQQQFTFFNRKHHCRICGKIFCTNCCSKQLSAPAVYGVVTTSEEQNKQQISPHRSSSHHHLSAAGSPQAAIAAPTAAQSSASAAATAAPAAATAPQGAPMVIVKVCRECYYDHQLAVCRREITTAEPRRKQRGELKMIQRARLIHICSYLPMKDLFNFSLVCSDFYFITRDNAIWIWHNASRWPDKRLTGKSMHTGSGTPAAGSTTNFNTPAQYRPTSDDDLSYHCSYNFTQFLHYCHLLEATRCEGLSNFANSARQVLSGFVKIAVIGPEKVGKTLMIQRFINGGGACVAPPVGAAALPPQLASSVYPLVPFGAGATSYRPTAGIAVSQKSVVISGGLSLESSGLTIIDVAGHSRYHELRTMACRGAHAIIMCYNVQSKQSLIDAALQTFAMEAELGPQPVIVCGIAGAGPAEVSPADAAPSSGRGKASIQVTPTALGGAEAFSAAIQAILEKLMDGGRHAGELLDITTNPSVLDVLLDLKG